MPAERYRRERGIVMAAVLMTLAVLSLLAAAGHGNSALQWAQARNARDYADAVGLAETGIGRVLAASSFRLDASESGRYCRTPARCVEWTVAHVETTPPPAGLGAMQAPARALHFEIEAEARAGRYARAPVVAGFLLIAPGAPSAPLPGAITVCQSDDGECPEGSAAPPVRRYWREAAD